MSALIIPLWQANNKQNKMQAKPASLPGPLFFDMQSVLFWGVYGLGRYNTKKIFLFFLVDLF